MTKINDPSLRTGVFIGDLAYGKCNGNMPERNGDYTGSINEPVCKLVLVQPRDPRIWSKDPMVKEARKYVVNDQFLIHGVVKAYMDNVKTMRSNMHLTVGKQRF